MLPDALPMFTLEGVLYSFDGTAQLWRYAWSSGWTLAPIHSSLQEAMIMVLGSLNSRGMISTNTLVYYLRRTLIDQNTISTPKSTSLYDRNYEFGFQTQLIEGVEPSHLRSHHTPQGTQDPAKVLLELYLDNCALVIAQREQKKELSANTNSTTPRHLKSVSNKRSASNSPPSHGLSQAEVEAWRKGKRYRRMSPLKVGLILRYISPCIVN